jgi:hypothetical protein
MVLGVLVSMLFGVSLTLLNQVLKEGSVVLYAPTNFEVYGSVPNVRVDMPNANTNKHNFILVHSCF